jgi:hypothetical protein
MGDGPRWRGAADLLLIDRGFCSMLSTTVMPAHKAVLADYERPHGYGAQDVTNEAGLR